MFVSDDISGRFCPRVCAYAVSNLPGRACVCCFGNLRGNGIALVGISAFNVVVERGKFLP